MNQTKSGMFPTHQIPFLLFLNISIWIILVSWPFLNLFQESSELHILHNLLSLKQISMKWCWISKVYFLWLIWCWFMHSLWFGIYFEYDWRVGFWIIVYLCQRHINKTCTKFQIWSILKLLLLMGCFCLQGDWFDSLEGEGYFSNVINDGSFTLCTNSKHLWRFWSIIPLMMTLVKTLWSSSRFQLSKIALTQKCRMMLLNIFI